MVVLDCSTFETTVASLETICALPRAKIIEIINLYDPATFSREYPQDYRTLKEVFHILLENNGAKIISPDYICWFHGTHVLNPETLKDGIRPLNQQIDQIWEDLFSIAKEWVEKEKWTDFRNRVESTDPGDSSQKIRNRLTDKSDWGPHGVLVRDALMNVDRFGGIDYLNMPETIEDICESFSNYFAQDLLSEFKKASVSCVVKFKDNQKRPDAIGAAMNYVWCTVKNESCLKCNTCFDGKNEILDENILDIKVFP